MAKKLTHRKKKMVPTALATAKRRPAKRAGKTAAANPAATGAAPAAAPCYVSVAAARVSIARGKPAGAAIRCQGFEQVKAAAIDALVSAIEDAERRLVACKRAATIDQLEAL